VTRVKTYLKDLLIYGIAGTVAAVLFIAACGWAVDTDAQLDALIEKWGDATGLAGRDGATLSDAEANMLYEYDQRGGAFFIEGGK
jgi:hypothetical protein